MTISKKNNQATDLKRIMSEKGISADDLARVLKVTTQTIYNLRRGSASEQLFDHAFIVVDNWEETK